MARAPSRDTLREQQQNAVYHFSESHSVSNDAESSAQHSITSQTPTTTSSRTQATASPSNAALASYDRYLALVEQAADLPDHVYIPFEDAVSVARIPSLALVN